jgi:hypothetical protein
MLEVPTVTDAEVAFGTTACLPKWDDVPEDFRDFTYNEHCKAVSTLFYSGGRITDMGYTLKQGLDENDVMRAIRACLCSWEPKHEHKIAGVGYMLSQWFDRK